MLVIKKKSHQEVIFDCGVENVFTLLKYRYAFCSYTLLVLCRSKITDSTKINNLLTQNK